METETCIKILWVVCASCCYIFVNSFTSSVTDRYLPQQEPMRAEGPKERPTAVLCVQLSARYVQKLEILRPSGYDITTF